MDKKNEEKNEEKQYKLSREAAGEVLGVSTRTVDRYIKAGRLSSRLSEGRIWLNEEEILEFKRGRESRHKVDNKDMSKSHLSSGHEVDKVDKVDNIEVVGQDIIEKMSTQRKISKDTTDTFKRLYEELKEELKEKQERLEVANYRVGQLEAQVRNSIPMLEYHRENYERQKTEDGLNKKLEESTGLIRNLSLKIKYEKFGKRVYVITLLIVLALQPLWFFFLSSSE